MSSLAAAPGTACAAAAGSAAPTGPGCFFSFSLLTLLRCLRLTSYGISFKFLYMFADLCISVVLGYV